MLALCLRFLRGNALRIGVVLGTFALVASFIFVQQMREAFAEQDYQAARNQVFAVQARAAQLGLDTAEYSDLQRQDLTTAAEAPPSATAPFNEGRIAFFSRAAVQESDLKEQLETRIRSRGTCEAHHVEPVVDLVARAEAAVRNRVCEKPGTVVQPKSKRRSSRRQ